MFIVITSISSKELSFTLPLGDFAALAQVLPSSSTQTNHILPSSSSSSTQTNHILPSGSSSTQTNHILPSSSSSTQTNHILPSSSTENPSQMILLWAGDRQWQERNAAATCGQSRYEVFSCTC